MMRILFSSLLLVLSFVAVATDYSYYQCEGSLTPYPDIDSQASFPDSLTPVFINHLGRHGSRYPASEAHCHTLRDALRKARKLGTLTPLGHRLESVNNEIIRLSSGRWGALDSLGKGEQRGIARRVYQHYPQLFGDGEGFEALSSHSPRSIESMEAFVGELRRLSPSSEITTSAGKEYNALVRPFDVDEAYLRFRKENIWEPPYKEYFAAYAPTSPIRRVLGEGYPFRNDTEARDLSLVEYYVLAGCSAMSMENSMDEYFTLEEANSLWSCFNLRQYLQRSASEVSRVPAEIAIPLVKDIIAIIDEFISRDERGESQGRAGIFRFGHGESVLPLVGLLQFPGCYYLTDDYASVSGNWHDFEIIPMAANVQFILFKAPSGRYYVRVELNEKAVQLFPEEEGDIYSWDRVKEYMQRLVR